jgi:actin-like ATPase involved in cell morphogenesis
MTLCGIDLGTTNSCIFLADGEEGRLVADDQDHPTFPSVVHVGAGGQRTVGHAARNRMGELPAPVVAVKRLIGTDQTVTLGGEETTPVEVSAMILAFLKELAERSSGGGVERAVVTVPAYFNHIQRQQTDEAGRLAGFREVITLLEPVAAALAYSLASQREALRIFVYDLGGGTFDATVLEKDRHGGIDVLAFGGDPFLGGEDVDARLAHRLLERLRERGYRLDLDLERPEDLSRFQRLRFYAELAKRELSERQEAALVRQGLFTDQDGEVVDLDLTVHRDELEECAADLVERSLEESRATLEKASIPRDSIDEVIMVGGMSRMPLVQRRLAELFDCQPQVVDPDLIVARGAAIKAREAFGEEAVAPSGLRLELRYEPRTDQRRVTVGGRFDRPLTDHLVYLLRGEEEHSRGLEGSDRFRFEGIRLEPGTENLFTLTVEDAEENPVLEREIRIVHDPECRRVVRSPGSVVTKEIRVRTADGAVPLFPENTPLPYRGSHTFETADQSGRIVVPILEGNHELTRLEVHDLPPELPIGTPVVVEMEAHADYRIEATARLPDHGRSAAIDFEIRPAETARLDPETVRRELAAIAEEAREKVERCTAAAAIEVFEVRLRGLTDVIETELSEPDPNRARLHDKLGELRVLVDQLPTPDQENQLEPSFADFSERLSAILTQAIEGRHPRLEEARPEAETLREEARKAWENRDPIAWRRIQGQLGVVAKKLEPERSPEERAMGMAAWLLLDQIPQLEQTAGGAGAGRVRSLRSQVEECLISLQLGIQDAEQVIGKLLGLYQEEIQPLLRESGLAASSQPQTADPRRLEGLLRQRQAGAGGG